MTDTSACPGWPETEPTAAELLRYFAGAGLHAEAATWGLMEATRDDREARSRDHRLLISLFQHAHDLHVALTALAELDPAKADEVAGRIWLAAEGGDSYGEWLYEWAESAGLDAEAICEQGRSAGKNIGDGR